MKVAMVRCRKNHWADRRSKPISHMLPFFQPEGDGYVHRARSAHMHYREDWSFSHTSVTFWCQQHGFLYEPGKQNKNHKPASMVASPGRGRVVCATCEARAIGSGQVGAYRIGQHFVKFKPHCDFFTNPRALGVKS